MLRRHPILFALALLLVLALAGGGWFLLRFDLDHYRSDLEQSLSRALGKPVHLGHARFALSHGLSLQFEEVRVGSDEKSDRFEAKQLALRLDLAPLLRRRLNFNRLYLERPVLHLALDPAGAPRPEGELQRSLEFVQEVARIIQVRSLLIRDGSIIASDWRLEQPRRWTLEQLELLVSNLALQQPVDLSATARLSLGKSSTPLTLSGTVTMPALAAAWRETSVRLQFTAKHFDPGPWLAARFAPPTPIAAHGSLDLLLALSGTPADGLAVQANLLGHDFALDLPEWYRHPLSLKQLQLAGKWRADSGHRFTDLACNWDGLSLQGSVILPTKGSLAGAEAALQLADLPLARLLPLLPEQPAPQLAENLRAWLRGGTLSGVSLRLLWPTSGSAGPLQVIQQGEFLLRDGAFELPQLGPVRDVALHGQWQESRLQLKDGRATLNAGSVDFSGEAGFSTTAPPQLALRARGLLDAAGAVLLLPLPPQSRQIAVGKAPVAITASGTSEHLSVNLQADLSDLGLSLFGETIKAAGDRGDLFAVADIRSGIAELGHARLTIPAGELHASGRVFLAPPHAYRLAVDLSRLDLEQLTRHDELARSLRVRGELALHLDLVGDDQNLQQREGWVDVRNLGLHFAGVVADLNRAGGRIRLEGERAVIESARGYLGTSVLTGTGTLELTREFRLALDIRGETLLASDLVFPSDRLHLSDLSGHLVIDSNGILFERIRTRLGDGTRAVVDGQLFGYAHPHLELAIAAEQANIAEVLALWQPPTAHNPNKEASPNSESHLTIRIEARAERGNLFGLPFRNGQGIVTLYDGMLRVHPVQLDTGSGFCRGQVVLRELSAKAPLLTITGHVENADAFAVYNQMLGRRGLVTGTLQGDFAIEGRLGSDFLPTAIGGCSFRVDQGGLRQFPILSKVFSVLNVSQIFALRLPDLTAEGMPFRRLQGTVALRAGTLRSEDLVVVSDAMNLALVGDFDLVQNRLDIVLGVKPLATVDKVVSSIPLAGWVLTGESKALVTAQFLIRGSSEDPKVEAIPITSVSDTVVGIFKRLFGLPAKVIEDLQGLVEGEDKKP